jgi:hypothetical protein
MPKIRRRCALCDAPLQDQHPTNTCRRCQDEEADHLSRRSPLIDAFPLVPSRPTITLQDDAASVTCFECHRPILNVTAICHPKNPIGDCPFVDEPHRHHFCACGVIIVTMTRREVA